MFLSKKDLYEQFTDVYTNLKKIPFDTLTFLDGEKIFDSFHLIEEAGDSLFNYLLKPFEAWQPKTYNYLMNGEFFYAVKTTPYPGLMGDITQLGIIVGGRVCYIHYTPYTYEKDKSDYAVIPLAMLNSWLYRAEGWDIAERTTTSIFRGVLPSTSTYNMSPIYSLLREMADKERRVLPQYAEFLEAKFNHAFRQTYQTEEFMDTDKYFELRCLLDTRLSDDWGKNGFQLFVSSHNTERNVYVVPRTDVMQIKKLSNPAEAIDSYAAHLLSGQAGEFDFLQYAEDF
ncbi:hypothetical protein [Pelistega sp. MC2]|uniref:hypothetical protein n=1 Tax=Pelistega sp. MC2 TaxID=1720297 RepID=UPI001C408FD3|nr:hypothetical protein [Pelistega sp. MC2]